jgi:GH43 family beta-xylosidase
MASYGANTMNDVRLSRLIAVTLGNLLCAVTVDAQNPLIRDQFTADPTARVFEGRVYVYPSHDVPPIPGKCREKWFCMEDYHVFSSENLIDWKDHGVIVKQPDVQWADQNNYSMWAPDCVFKDGKYYFYFPATAKEKGFKIGVATADKPYGPFTLEATAIEGVRGIDPSVLVEKDGTSYIYYSLNKIFVARLKANMRELDLEPQVIDNLPTKGLLEGPFVFERHGTYYLTYPHVENKTERLEYAMGKSPMGPFQPAGVIMDESASGCWTNHHSIVEYQGQWYLFYHDKDLSPGFDKNRAIRADRLFFNADGTIQKVLPTLRGVGVAEATSTLQIDRYSVASPEGIAVSFLNDADTFAGWRLSLEGPRAWVRFDQVSFTKKPALRRAQTRLRAPAGGQIEIRVDSVDGPVISRIDATAAADWQIVSSKLGNVPSGVRNLVVTRRGSGRIGLDWIRFE